MVSVIGILTGIERKQTKEEAHPQREDMILSGKRSGKRKKEKIPFVNDAKLRIG